MLETILGLLLYTCWLGNSKQDEGQNESLHSSAILQLKWCVHKRMQYILLCQNSPPQEDSVLLYHWKTNREFWSIKLGLSINNGLCCIYKQKHCIYSGKKTHTKHLHWSNQSILCENFTYLNKIANKHRAKAIWFHQVNETSPLSLQSHISLKTCCVKKYSSGVFFCLHKVYHGNTVCHSLHSHIAIYETVG